MAKVKAFGRGDYDMRQIDFGDLLYGIHYVERSDLFRVEYYGGMADQFKGKGFRYDNDGVPVAGTVTSYTLLDSNTKLVTIEGLSIAATKFVKAAYSGSSSDDMALIRTALKGNDQLQGSSGDDNILGFNGNDALNGGSGRDTLNGGDGKDTLTGAAGADTLIGGAGADRFVFQRLSDSNENNTDTIRDFSHKQGDRIDLKAIDARTTAAGNDKFSFIGDDDFSGKAGELRYSRNGSFTVIEGDVDGDGNADLVIHVRGKVDFAASDFIL